MAAEQRKSEAVLEFPGRATEYRQTVERYTACFARQLAGADLLLGGSGQSDGGRGQLQAYLAIGAEIENFLAALQLVGEQRAYDQLREMALRLANYFDVEGQYEELHVVAQLLCEAQGTMPSPQLDLAARYCSALAELRGGRFQHADRLALEAGHIAVQLGDSSAASRCERLRGLAHYFQGEFAAALDCYQHSLELAYEADDQAAEANLLNNLGLVEQDMGDYAAAREHLQQALAWRRSNGDKLGECATLTNLGLVALSEGRVQEARQLHAGSYALRSELGDRNAAASSLNNLGLTYSVEGNHAQAREYYARSAAVRCELGDRYSEAISLNNLGNAELELGHVEEANAAHSRSLELRRSLGDRYGQAQGLNNLGTVALARRDFQAAQALFERSLEIKLELGDRRGRAISLSNLAAVHYWQGEYGRSAGFLLQALEQWQQLGVQSEIQCNCVLCCALLLRLGLTAAGLASLAELLADAGLLGLLTSEDRRVLDDALAATDLSLPAPALGPEGEALLLEELVGELTSLLAGAAS